MSGQSNIDISYEGRNIEDQLSAALHGTIKYVTHLQSSVSWKKVKLMYAPTRTNLTRVAFS